MAVRIYVNNREVARILHSPSGPTARHLIRRGAQVQAYAKRNLYGGVSGPKRVDTGELINSITNRQVVDKGGLRQRVGSRLLRSKWVHDGTGLYGPRRMRITPKNGKYLAWQSARYGAKTGKYKGWVFAKSTKGMRGNRYLSHAIRQVFPG